MPPIRLPRAITVASFFIVTAIGLAGCGQNDVVLRPSGAIATPRPGSTATAVATATPTAVGTATAAPTNAPTTVPTTTPTTAPTSAPTAKPTAAPTATPTPKPTASAIITLTPSSVTLNQPNSGCSQPTTATFVATETGYTGNFKAVSANTAIATVAATTGSGNFTVTDTEAYNAGGIQYGTTITVTDSKGNSATEEVGEYTCLP